MDFSQVKDITTRDGIVKYIAKKENGNTGPCYWKRPFTYPVAGFCLYSNFISRENNMNIYISPTLLLDKYGVSKRLSILLSSKNTDGSTNVYYNTKAIRLPNDTDEIDANDYGSSKTWIAKGLENKSLRFFVRAVSTETQLSNFPETGMTNSSIRFRFSDKQSGKIKLYASPVEDIETNNTWRFTNLVLTAIYRDHEYREITHDTDITVTAGTPLITLSSDNSYMPTISSVRNNFDEYKEKYNTATGGKFPKSSYPYLVGLTELTASTPPILANKWCVPGHATYGWSSMYFYFVVKR